MEKSDASHTLCSDRFYGKHVLHLSRDREHDRSFFAGGMAIVLAIALAKLLLHCYFNNRYGYFRDEFDYMACGDHLAWGYVDQPPMIPFLIHICRAVLGDSLRSVRFIPALASSLLVVQTAVLAREFGGRRFALLLSAVTILVAPQYLSNGSLLGTNCLEPNLWMGCAYFVILAIKRNDLRNWLWFGVVAGLGYAGEVFDRAVWFRHRGRPVVHGATPRLCQQMDLAGRGGGISGFSAQPLVEHSLHWPFVQLMRGIRAEGRDVVLPLLPYFFQQTLLVLPLTAPIWITGLIALFFSERLKMYRVLGWSYLVCFTVFFVLHGKNYYLAPIYPMLLAAGAVTIENAFERPRLSWMKPAIVVVVIAAGVHLAPVVVPVLSPDRFIAYMKYLPKLPVMEHGHERAVLPQWYADQFGWEEIVAETAQAWNRLSPEERSDCGIFAQDYGRRRNRFSGRRYGLPPALSGHQTYFLWGPRGYWAIA